MGSNTYVRADVWTVAQTDQGNVVLVRPRQSDMVVPIFIGQLETQSILIGLGRVEMPRPLTHDLLMSVVHALEAELVRVEIRDLRERTFYANIVIKSIEGEKSMDARPSDALALAIRSGAEVYISEEIVDSAGVPIDMIRETPLSEAPHAESDVSGNFPGTRPADEPGRPAMTEAELEREKLRSELETAIAVEDYEKAARIRDRLRFIQ
jgi:bifunctional DNase/RNase